MNRRRADGIVGLLTTAILLIGGTLSWQAYQQNRLHNQMMGSMMGTSMGTSPGTSSLWYILGTFLISAIVVGLYLTVRDTLPTTDVNDRPVNESRHSLNTEAAELADVKSQRNESADSEERPNESACSDVQTTKSIDPEEQPKARILDLLPEDERRILKPVLTSPGVTQIELRDRSDFSKSKVSQTVSALEKRGLLYRERQGRTYRIYPSDELHQTHD
ncbi:helix-turn-helix transcriptional regulator [Halomicrococcus sp. NG-SE-24]|uniref:helix-turn-helix transcriptional regulator n=1 Tax=Halomicrococcus sp. NG-SE-24 TaxID=3436928 RepID=UPI003D97959C